MQGEGRTDDDELQELPSSTIALSFSLSKRGMFEFSFLMFPWLDDNSPPLKLEVILHEFSWAFRPNDLRGVLTRSAALVVVQRQKEMDKTVVRVRVFGLLLMEFITYPGLRTKREFKSATGKDPPLGGSSNSSIGAAEDLMSASAAPESSDTSLPLPVTVSMEETT